MKSRLTLIHLAGNTVLLALGYYWLGLPESRTGALAWSAFIALAIVAAACALYGAAFISCALPPLGWRRALITAARRLPALILCAIFIGAIYLLLDRAHDLLRTPSFRVASWLTLKFRRPVRPAAVLRDVDFALTAIRWAVIPLLTLPLFAGVAILGHRGFRCIGLLARSARYWVLTPLLLLCALWVPFKILGWTPHSSSFAIEMLSFIARAAAAYALFTAAGLAIVYLTATATPRFTQSKTAP